TSSVTGMEEARSVLERFERIESMRRANAGPVELLGELRSRLREAEAWVRVEGGDAGDDAVARLRQALERDMIRAGSHTGTTSTPPTEARPRSRGRDR